MRTVANLVLVLATFAGCGADSPGQCELGDTCATNADCDPCDGNVCSGLRCTPPAACDEALLSWDGPVANTDGTCLTDLGGFKVRWGATMGGPYEHEVDVGLDGCAAGEDMTCGLDGAMSTATQLKCSYRITGLENGTTYITVTSYNTAGVESTPSGEAAKTVACP